MPEDARDLRGEGFNLFREFVETGRYSARGLLMYRNGLRRFISTCRSSTRDDQAHLNELVNHEFLVVWGHHPFGERNEDGGIVYEAFITTIVRMIKLLTVQETRTLARIKLRVTVELPVSLHLHR